MPVQNVSPALTCVRLRLLPIKLINSPTCLPRRYAGSDEAELPADEAADPTTVAEAKLPAAQAADPTTVSEVIVSLVSKQGAVPGTFPERSCSKLVGLTAAMRLLWLPIRVLRGSLGVGCERIGWAGMRVVRAEGLVFSHMVAIIISQLSGCLSVPQPPSVLWPRSACRGYGTVRAYSCT